MLGVSLHFCEITLHMPNLQGGDGFECDCVRHRTLFDFAVVFDQIVKPGTAMSAVSAEADIGSVTSISAHGILKPRWRDY